MKQNKGRSGISKAPKIFSATKFVSAAFAKAVVASVETLGFGILQMEFLRSFLLWYKRCMFCITFCNHWKPAVIEVLKKLQEKFTELLRGLSDLELTDAERDKLFTHVVGDSASMTKETFLEPWQDLGTCHYKNPRFFGPFWSMGS